MDYNVENIYHRNDKRTELEKEIEEKCREKNIKCMECMNILGGKIACNRENDKQITLQMKGIVENMKPMLLKLMDEEMPKQIALLLLRFCAQPRLAYYCRIMKPHFMKEAAKYMDELCMKTFIYICDLFAGCAEEIDLNELEGGQQDIFENVQLDYQNILNEDELTQCYMRISDGGIGMRNISDECDIAYIASLMNAIPNIRALHTINEDDIQMCSTNIKLMEEVQFLKRKYNNCTDKINDVIEGGIQNIWTIEPENVPKNIQKQLNNIIHECKREELLNRLDEENETRIRIMSASNPNAGLWLTAIPTAENTELRMKGDNICYSIKHLLGKSPTEDLIDGMHYCKCGHKFEQEDVKDAHKHFHTCIKFTGNTIKARHDCIKHTIGKHISIESGAYVQYEPNQYKADNIDDNNEEKERRNSSMSMEEEQNYTENELLEECADSNRHGDIVIINDRGIGYVDVSCTEPTSKTNLKIRNIYTEKRVSMRARIKKKREYYRAICKAHGMNMYTAVFETYGSCNDDVIMLLNTFANSSSEQEKQLFVQSALRKISVALQNGNANIARTGVMESRIYSFNTDSAFKCNVQLANVPIIRHTHANFVEGIRGDLDVEYVAVAS